jgi:hypothetical protein
MKARGIVLLGVSALLGLAAVTWVKKPYANAGMTSVVVAKVALNFGDQLTAPKLSQAVAGRNAACIRAARCVHENR